MADRTIWWISGLTATAAQTPEPCDAIDRNALQQVVDVAFHEPGPYEHGPNYADGCYVGSKAGEVTIAVDLRTRHGSLTDHIEFVSALANERHTPPPLPAPARSRSRERPRVWFEPCVLGGALSGYVLASRQIQ